MGRQRFRLTARQVATAGPGYHPDGDGLYLLVSASGSRSWVLRYSLRKKAREMGMGSATVYGLAEARQRAQAARRLLAEGVDPIEARARHKNAQGRTWGEAAEDFITAQEPGWKDPVKQGGQWRQSLEAYGPDKALPVSSVDTALVVKLLGKVWATKTETATRVRGRIERIWDAERVAGTVKGDNPARWKGHLEALLPKPAKVGRKRHHKAMPYADVPAFMAGLAGRKGRTARALRFTILTGARTGEVTGAQWSEFDFKAKRWRVPAERMKGGREHVVPLTDAALAVLEGLPRNKPPFDLSANSMLFLVQKPAPKGCALPYTVHGFRSSFSDWAHETTEFPHEVIEMALAHTIKNKTEAAYRRGALLEKRRALMEAWAGFLSGHTTAPCASPARSSASRPSG